MPQHSGTHVTASILYPSITIRLRRVPGNFCKVPPSRSFVPCDVRVIFCRWRDFFGRCAKLWVVAIDFVQKSTTSELSLRFLSLSKFENSLATFWWIQPIIPGFMRMWLRFTQIPGWSAEFAKNWHMDFFVLLIELVEQTELIELIQWIAWLNCLNWLNWLN